MSTSQRAGSGGTISVEEATENIRRTIALLRADEIAAMGQRKGIELPNFISRRIGWLKATGTNFSLLVKYSTTTWLGFFSGIFKGQLDFEDALSVFIFAGLTTSVLVLIFLWCLVASFPPFVWLYNIWSSRFGDHMSLVNIANPKIFNALTKDQGLVATQKLRNPVENTNTHERIFDLDVAKLLLQLSSVVYERSPANVQAAVSKAYDNLKSDPKADPYQAVPSVRNPGSLLRQLVDGDYQINRIFEMLEQDSQNHSDIIDALAKDHGLCWVPVSELATTSQAYCSIFWDPLAKWMVVVFKGTDPVSFEEWLTDFKAAFADASDDIPGFKHAHRGFMERLFGPANGLAQGPTRRPSDTITAAINIVATELIRCHGGDEKVNVWMTGHSLGTAIASLAYAKALMSNNLGEHAVLRDAYLFATPIICDQISRMAFNKAIQRDPEIPRNIFRVTNRSDFVATGLPAFGDRTDSTIKLDPDNLFNFCHIGQEIFMKTAPPPCEIQGDALPPDVKVLIGSHYSPEQIIQSRQNALKAGWVISRVLVKLQDIPFIGRLVAHATVMYWDQLDQIAVNQHCVVRP